MYTPCTSCCRHKSCWNKSHHLLTSLCLRLAGRLGQQNNDQRQQQGHSTGYFTQTEETLKSPREDCNPCLSNACWRLTQTLLVAFSPFLLQFRPFLLHLVDLWQLQRGSGITGPSNGSADMSPLRTERMPPLQQAPAALCTSQHASSSSGVKLCAHQLWARALQVEVWKQHEAKGRGKVGQPTLAAVQRAGRGVHLTKVICAATKCKQTVAVDDINLNSRFCRSV